MASSSAAGKTPSKMPEKSQTSQGSVASPSKQPTPRPTPSARTENPAQPQPTQQPQSGRREELNPVGNREFELSLKLESRLGFFQKREVTISTPVYLEFRMDVYRDAIYRDLCLAFEHTLRMKGYIEDEAVLLRARSVAAELTNGCTVATYQKMLMLHKFNPDQKGRFVKRPKLPHPFKVPNAFALAISQLGLVKISSRTDNLKVMPTMPNADALRMGLDPGQRWSPTNYASAVEYAKSLGMQFDSVDLAQKVGSAWWLFRQDVTEDIFTLQCRIPENNYSESTAVLHSLWINTANGYVENNFVNLDPLGNHVYGTMLRCPHVGIALSTFLAIESAHDPVSEVV
ncbi:ORF1 [Lomandra cryptic virus 1]|nr:ORF1 [Lomandra cryptic virus 1]